MDALQGWRQHAQPELDRSPDHEFKREIREHYDRLASRRDHWYRRNRRYHDYIERSLTRLLPAGQAVLELGCGTGNLLGALRPQTGYGIDLSPAMVEIARRKYPTFRFDVQDAEQLEGGPKLDIVVASDLVGELLDITAMLERVQAVSRAETRLVLTFHNPALEGLLRVGQRAALTMPPARQNWIGPNDVLDLLALSDFETEHVQTGLLLSALLPGLEATADAIPATTPVLGWLNAVTIVVARPRRPRTQTWPLSCSVIIPCRNEVGNIEAAVARMPVMGSSTEIVFVDGASSDGTPDRIEEMRRRYAGVKPIRLIHQVEAPAATQASLGATEAPAAMLKLGKGDAVRKGFTAARGDVLMILDADLTVPPEDLPRFFNAIAAGKADFANGNRLLYPMEERAMKFINYVGNKFFGSLFTWMLGQRIRDTLCGTKALRRESYDRIVAGRAEFGDFDPFGDFDLLFGAARLGLRIVDVPVRYRRRRSGVTKVRVVRHGLLLLAMSAVAFRAFKLPGWLGGRR
ncbi:MAG TPA: glycosyltransferase [Candidatus Dormibacteraeota bacterium]|nr:glycosyltransferase [Candidatus Dormibacteraeota bacterium]